MCLRLNVGFEKGPHIFSHSEPDKNITLMGKQRTIFFNVRCLPPLASPTCAFYTSVCVYLIDNVIPIFPVFNVDTAPDGGLTGKKLDRCISYP